MGLLRQIKALRSSVAATAAAADLTQQATQALRHDLLALAEQQTAIAAQLERHDLTLAELEAMAAKLEAAIAGQITDGLGLTILGLEATAARLEAAVARQTAHDEQTRTEVLQGLRRVHANEAWHRRRLREAREAPEYERAYSDETPLISVLIATYDRLEILRSRSIPSILAQDYTNFEIVIVGDHAPFGQAELCRGFEDAPIRFANLDMQGPYPEDAFRRWLVAGSPPFNEALHLARGTWIAPFDDDDYMRPHQLRTLLTAARERRLELVYGRCDAHLEDGSTLTIGDFPPRMGGIAAQAALLHGALSFFELELSDGDFGTPIDWGHIDRLLRAGVRVGMVDDVLTDYYPSKVGYAFRGAPADPR